MTTTPSRKLKSCLMDRMFLIILLLGGSTLIGCSSSHLTVDGVTMEKPVWIIHHGENRTSYVGRLDSTSDGYLFTEPYAGKNKILISSITKVSHHPASWGDWPIVAGASVGVAVALVVSNNADEAGTTIGDWMLVLRAVAFSASGALLGGLIDAAVNSPHSCEMDAMSPLAKEQEIAAMISELTHQ